MEPAVISNPHSGHGIRLVPLCAVSSGTTLLLNYKTMAKDSGTTKNGITLEANGSTRSHKEKSKIMYSHAEYQNTIILRMQVRNRTSTSTIKNGSDKIK